VACAQVAKKPNRKADHVNSPADTFRFCHLPSPGLLLPSPPASSPPLAKYLRVGWHQKLDHPPA
jgi:hypothetical protein